MVDRPDRLDPIKRIGDDKQTGGPVPQPGSFESAMEKAARQPSPTTKPSGPSPMELAQNQTPLTQGPTFDSLLSQTKSVQGLLGDVNTQLQTKNLKLKQSDRASLRSKLKNANTYLKAANTKIGAEVMEEPPATSGGGGILSKFLGYVTQGQANVAAAQKQLQTLKSKGDSLNPADFFAVQIKLAHAQQEIEYASIMLANAVSGLKTLFNIQL
ncbi:MAG TPA: hypothetical protein VHK67_06645 [Rhabdochlamydiaceae bacterium]|jgi:hypothetical protein|nr:hypothetical protein [Rhabdochlamydiaceae bacterium]